MNIPAPIDKSKSSTDYNEVNFTAKQLAYLEKLYPELIGTRNTTEAELRIAQGYRMVISTVRGRVRG